MLATISKNCFRLRHTPISIRTFLSESYRLTDAWNARLSTPILEKIKVDTFFYELEQKFNQQKVASPIDIDIYANKVTDDNHLDEIGDLLNKLRKTSEATNILDSTGHAYVRTLIDYDQIEQLIQMLDNRMEYGIFLDDYAANLVIDKLLKAGKFKEAARITTIFMLQEDFSNEITRALSLFACYKYLGNPEVFDDLIPPPEPVVEKGQKKKKKEEIKIRVKYLRNPYFDDHFDIRDSQHLVGKSLCMIGKEYSAKGDVKFGTNVQLLGLSLYQKYEDAHKLLNGSKGTELEKDVVEKINEALTKVGEEQQKMESFQTFKSAMDLIGSSHKVVEGNFEEKINDLCKKSVQDNEAKDMEQQKKVRFHHQVLYKHLFTYVSYLRSTQPGLKFVRND